MLCQGGQPASTRALVSPGSQLLGLMEKRQERFWSLHGKNPHIQGKILVTQGPRTCLCMEAGDQTGSAPHPSTAPSALGPCLQEQVLPTTGTELSSLGPPSSDSCPLFHALGLTLEGSRGTLTSGLGFFSPLALVSLVLNSNFKAKRGSHRPRGRDKRIQILLGKHRGPARLGACAVFPRPTLPIPYPSEHCGRS